MTSVSAGHIILTPTQPVGSGWPQRESNPGPPYQESRALPTELPRPPSCVGEGTVGESEAERGEGESERERERGGRGGGVASGKGDEVSITTLANRHTFSNI